MSEKPHSLDADFISRGRIQSFVETQKDEIFPQGSRTPYGVVFPRIRKLIESTELNMHSKEDRDAFLGILVGLVPEGEGATALRDMISEWLPPQ